MENYRPISVHARVMTAWHRSGTHAGTANRRDSKSKVRSCGLPHIQGEDWWVRGATPCPNSEKVAVRRYPMYKDRRSGQEEIPHIQGKRNPSKMVGTERGHQRAYRLKPQSQRTSQSDNTGDSLV